MTKEEFVGRMPVVDKALANLGVPAFLRSFSAPGMLDPRLRDFVFVPFNPRLDPYSGCNLFHSVCQWYTDHYEEKACVPALGQRPILIRGEVFTVTIPPVFNNTTQKAVQKYIHAMPDALWSILDNREKTMTQNRFDLMLSQVRQLVNLNLGAGTEEFAHPIRLRDFIIRGYTDLVSAASKMDKVDPHATVWDCQHAAEKYLKAYIVFKEPLIAEETLKKKLGHNVEKLLVRAMKHAFVALVLLPELNSVRE